MATINLGAIKFNWRGAYAGGTAYTVDDVVSSGGSSYVCILASTGNTTSNATYWSVMASAGTDGTDLTSTLTTQGDVLYRDGSGLQRLAKGTAGQVLQMNAGATAPEYGTVSSDYVLLATSTASSTGEMLFNGYFSSTYERYVLAYYDIYFSTNSQLLVRFMRGGSSITASNYKSFVIQGYTDSTPSNSVSTARTQWNGTSMQLTNGDNPSTVATSARLQGELMLFNPLNTSTYKTIQATTSYSRTTDLNTMHVQHCYGRLEDSTNALSGINITGASGNFVTGTFKLYGIK